MGERGPAPIPHARRRNKCLSTGKRIEVAAPPMPADLDGEAAAEWERIVPEIEAMGILATLDRGALVRYCRGWADWCELDETLRATRLLVKGRRNGLVRNPLCDDAERHRGHAARVGQAARAHTCCTA